MGEDANNKDFMMKMRRGEMYNNQRLCNIW
jgi:hypothetical protein